MIKDEELNWTEASISINGVALNFAQSMALRVAATNFHLQMSRKGALGNDPTGISIAKNYHARMTEVLKLMTQAEK